MILKLWWSDCKFKFYYFYYLIKINYKIIWIYVNFKFKIFLFRNILKNNINYILNVTFMTRSFCQSIDLVDEFL